MSTHNITDIAKGVKVSKGERSTLKIEGEIPFEALETHRSAAVKALGKEVSIDGFRKGHVPENILVKHIGEMAILSEMAERALAEVYPAILKAHDIDAIGRPDISITKIAPNNPLGFTATVAVLPEITLPDYKAIAKEQNVGRTSAEVTDADVAAAIERIQRQKLAYDRIQEKARKQKEAQEGGLTLPTPETVETEEDESTLPVPELTDTYVATLGNFKDVADFKTQIRDHLVKEKQEEVTSKYRAALTDAIVGAAVMEIPQVLIDAELNQMFGQMENDLARAGLTAEGYLSHIKKTREDLAKEWTPAAEKRAKLQLILNEIAKVEKIEPDKSRVIHDVAHLMSHYKDADETRVKIYVESMLRNEAVMAMLESQK